jgi:hypothetical protein
MILESLDLHIFYASAAQGGRSDANVHRWCVLQGWLWKLQQIALPLQMQMLEIGSVVAP